MGLNLDGCTALITGASAGIGRELARQLGPRAGALVLIARRQNRLEELSGELKRQHPGLNLEIRVADLSDEEQIASLVEWLEEEAIEVDFLINNAGVGDRGSFVTSAPRRVEDMLRVNVFALTVLTRHLLPAMIERGRGAILNVSSSASFLPIPGMAVYAATKAYVTNFSEALRSEVRGSGIRVQALCPGPVHTEFDSIARRPDASGPAAPALAYVPVEEVVRAALNGIEHDRPLVIPGLAMKITMTLARLTPMPILRLASRVASASSR